MLRVRSLKRVATGDAISLPAAEALPISASQSLRLRIPVTPVVLLFLCGLVAARVFPDSSPISSEAGLGPRLVLPQIQRPQLAFPKASPGGTNLTGLQLRCQSFCLTRDAYVTRDEVSHCQSQCLAHPEVMDWMRALEASAAAPAGVSPDRQLIFAAWYAEGDRGSEDRSPSAEHPAARTAGSQLILGHDNHQLVKPDTSFISTLRKSHPGCSIALLTDQATQFDLPEGVRLFRHTIDRSKLGRNAYANYYQYQAQMAFMQTLMAEGVADTHDVVFLDMDVLVVDSLAEIFEDGSPFDYGVTLSDAVDMPVNLGMQFVPRGRYLNAIGFLSDVIAIYPFNETFIAGQVALSNLVSIHNNAEEVLSRVNASIVEGRSCKLVAGRHRVCFFPCMRFNYCHADQSCCTDVGRLPVSLTTLEELMSARVKVLHFVGHRKKALRLVHQAYMQGGLQGAYQLLSVLPHSEQDYAELDIPALEDYLLHPPAAAAA